MPSHVIRARPPRGHAGPVQLDTDPARLGSHLQDAAHVPGGHAAALATPQDEAQVAEVLSRSRTVLAIGAQSSLTGGATPMGETLLSTSRLRSLDLTRDGVEAGAGVTLVELDAALVAEGRWYPPAPTFAGATVGGIVATNAAGAATFKYGATRSWVEGLTVVLASGDVLDLRRGDVQADTGGACDLVLADRTVRLQMPTYRMPGVPKVSAGYYAAPAMDLLDLFIGAEGTLGVVTSVMLRTAPRPPQTALLLVCCTSQAVGLRVVADLRAASRRSWADRDPKGIDVSAIEHIDRDGLDLLRADGLAADLHVPVPDDTALALLVTLELPPEMDAGAAYEAIAGALDGTAPDSGVARVAHLLAGAGLLERTEFAGPSDTLRRQQLVALREAVPTAVNRRIGLAQRAVDARIEKVAADVIVPFECVERLLSVCRSEFSSRRLSGAVWGHISDGNLHPNVIPGSVGELQSGREAILAIGRQAIAMGGSPCAEHGVGRNRIKQQLLLELYGRAGVADMRRIKQALDPERKLAPGVLGL